MVSYADQRRRPRVFAMYAVTSISAWYTASTAGMLAGVLSSRAAFLTALFPGTLSRRSSRAMEAPWRARSSKGGDLANSSLNAATREAASARPAADLMRHMEQERAKSPVEQLLGLEGGRKRNIAYVFAWLLCGTLFYLSQEFEELDTNSPVFAFYYAVQAGLSIGFGTLTPRSEDAMLFSICYILVGAAILANFLSTFVTDVISELERSRPGAATRDRGGLYGRMLALWWIVGTLFGHYHEGWSWTRALFFAVSATSTAGMQGLESRDEASLFFCAVYSLLGVPLFAAAMGRLAFALAKRSLYVRRAQIRQRTVQLVEHCNGTCAVDIFDMHDSSGEGYLDKEDLSRLIKFLANAKGMVVTDDDIAYFIAEFDVDGNCVLDRREFLQGIARWAEEKQEPEYWDETTGHTEETQCLVPGAGLAHDVDQTNAP